MVILTQQGETNSEGRASLLYLFDMIYFHISNSLSQYLVAFGRQILLVHIVQSRQIVTIHIHRVQNIPHSRHALSCPLQLQLLALDESVFY